MTIKYQRTRHEQNTEHLAAYIYDVLMYGENQESIKAGLAENGLTFDIRYDDGDYVSSTDWTRVHDYQPNEATFSAAILIAKSWVKRDTSSRLIQPRQTK